MWYLLTRTAMVALSTGVAAGAIFAAYLLWRGRVLTDEWESIAAVAAAGALAAGFVFVIYCIRQQRKLRAIADGVDQFVGNPKSRLWTTEQRRRSRLAIAPSFAQSLENLANLFAQGEESHPVTVRQDLPSETENKLRKQAQELSTTNQRLRRINRDLERLKESYRDLYHNSPVMYFSLDPNGNFVTLNETLLNALGFERAELLNRSYTDLLPSSANSSWEFDLDQEKKSRKERPLRESLTREGEVETRWKKKDGAVIDVLIRTMPVVDENGKFVRSRSAAQDMTERKRLANELRGRGDELERANAKLRRINTELEEFTSVVSHDLKEPLRTLQAYTGLLVEDFSQALGTDGFEYINNLVLASRRMERLIEDLLHLSWAGRINRDLETFSLNQTLANVRRDLGDLMQRRNAEIHIDGSLPDVKGDSIRIAQLFANLVGNGIKYNKSAKPTVHVGVAIQRPQPNGQSAPDGHAVIYVRDNGIGIDPLDQQKIFGMFRRLHHSSEFEGTGAGLAICKKIVESHNGVIWVESQKDSGATFFVSLPASKTKQNGKAKSTPSKASAAPKPSPRPIVKSKAPVKTSPAKNRLLLVEDMAEIGAIAKRLGERAGHAVTWVPTAERAWEYLQSSIPDLILLDVNLPGMSGPELCEKLHGTTQFKDIPIAIFTQDSHSEVEFKSPAVLKVLPKSLLSEPAAWQHQLNELFRQAAER